MTSIDGSGIIAELGNMAGVSNYSPRQRLCELPSNRFKGGLLYCLLWDALIKEEWDHQSDIHR